MPQIQEYLDLSKQWLLAQDCQRWLFGYVCKRPTEAREWMKRFAQPINFLGDNFTIVAAVEQNLGIVVVVAERFLFDPSACSFIENAGELFLPLVERELDLGSNLARNISSNYNQRVEIFTHSIERAIMRSKIVPVLVCPKTAMAMIWEYFVQQGFYTHSSTELNDALSVAMRNIKLINALIANTLIEACSLFQKFFALKPKMTQQEIEDVVMNLTFVSLDSAITHYVHSNIGIDRIFSCGKFVSQQMVLVKNMIQFFFNCIQETIDTIQENDFEELELPHVLESCIENYVGKFTVYMHEFSLVGQADFLILFEKIKETLFDLVYDIETFIVLSAQFINAQMEKVNQIFKDYPAIANVRTFQAIQIDASNYIMSQLKDFFLTQNSNFWRHEQEKASSFIKKVIIFYINYKVNKIALPNKTQDFFTALIRMGLDPVMPIQTIQLILSPDEIDYIALRDEIHVSNITLIKHRKIVAYKFFCQETNDFVILQVINKYVVLAANYLYNPNEWVEADKRELQPRLLSQVVSEILQSEISMKELTLFEQQQTGLADQKESKLVLHFNLEIQDQIQAVRSKFMKKYKQAQRVGGSHADPGCMAAGAVGSGLGILIVDCLDDSIPWHMKLQRAGYGTVETTAYAALSMSLPFVGFLLSQTLLFYGVHKVFSNKVVDMPNKMKNFGHLGVKTSMGIGSALAGQMLIPVPLLGALIGSMVGGVGVGLYHKFVIPTTRNSLLRMVNRLLALQQKNGSLKFDKKAFELLKISPSFFYTNKPGELTENDWLTLFSVHLVNEIQTLYEVQCEEKRKKIMEKVQTANSVQEFVELDVEQEEQEATFLEWEKSRYYVQQQQISSFKYALQIGEFVTGMMSNFKI